MSEIKKSDLRPAFIWAHQRGKTRTEIAEWFGVSRKMVGEAIKRFESTGKNKNRKGSGRKRTAKRESNIQAVANAIAQNPSTKVNSTRKLARKLKVSQTSIVEILKKELKLFPYKLLDRQELTPEHVRKRLKLCREMKQRFSDGRHRFIIFSDEKIFTIEQARNRQNDRIYATSPPVTEERLVAHQQHPKQVMVWAAIGYGVKLPLVFVDSDYHYDQVYYRQKVLRETLKAWAEENLEGESYCFQQDGATSHTANDTQDWLERRVPDYIKKNQWPPRSPDLNPLDYSIWSILEERACREPHETEESLKAALEQAWEELDEGMLRRIVDDFPRRLDACIEAGGKHFE